MTRTSNVLELPAARLPVAMQTLAELGLDANTWRVLTESIFPGAKTADGILLGSKHLAVPARSLRQLSVRQLFGTAEQEVDPIGSVAISGDVAFTAYMTVIDGTSQDPVFVMPE